MALFVVISDFQGPASLHLKENAVIDDALYDIPTLEAAGLQIVPATPDLLAAIGVDAPASTEQIIENAANADTLVFNEDGEVLFDENGEAFTVL